MIMFRLEPFFGIVNGRTPLSGNYMYHQYPIFVRLEPGVLIPRLEREAVTTYIWYKENF